MEALLSELIGTMSWLANIKFIKQEIFKIYIYIYLYRYVDYIHIRTYM